MRLTLRAFSRTTAALVFGLASLGYAAPAAATRSEAQIAALAVAETFGYAWAHRDAAAGKATLDFGESEGSPSADTVVAYFRGLSTPGHFAFAVESLKQQPNGEILARLTLYAFVYDGRAKSEYPATSVTLRLARVGSAWKIVAVSGLYGL